MNDHPSTYEYDANLNRVEQRARPPAAAPRPRARAPIEGPATTALDEKLRAVADQLRALDVEAAEIEKTITSAMASDPPNEEHAKLAQRGRADSPASESGSRPSAPRARRSGRQRSVSTPRKRSRSSYPMSRSTRAR